MPFKKDPHYERWRWQVFAVTWLAYAGFNLTRNSFSVSKIALAQSSEIGLSQREMTAIDGGFLAAYALGQVIWGIGGDRFGARKVVAIGMLASVLAGILMGASSSALAFGLCFLAQGLCQSCGWAPLLKNVGNFFSQGERGVVFGLWCTNYALGGLVSSVYAGYVGEHLGWRFAFFVPAATLLVVWLIFLIFQRDRPEDVGLVPIEQYHSEPAAVVQAGDSPEDEQEGSWKTIAQVARNPIVLRLSLVYFFLKPTRYAILFWGPKYVNERLGAGMAESGALTAMFELAGPFSVLASGIISDRLFSTKRLPPAVFGLLLLAGALITLDFVPQTRLWLGASLFLLGFLAYGPDSLISGVAAVDFGTRKGASTAGGLINAAGSLGAMLGVSLAGFFQKELGWTGVFVGLAGGAVISALLLLPKWNALPASAVMRGQQIKV